MDKNQIVKSNQVIEASYQLSAVEQRIVLAAISRIPKSQPITDDELYPVSVNELQLLGVHEKTAYRDLKEGINRLYERSINLSIDDKVVARARATSKKKAEEKACQRAYFAFQDKIDKKCGRNAYT